MPEKTTQKEHGKELGKQLKKIGMLVVQDQVWNRVTINRAAHKTTRYYLDEFHLLLKEEQTASYSVEIWKRYRKWGGIPTGITQNVKDLLSSREVENIFENSDFIYMLNQAAGDRQILAKQLNISPHQLSYSTTYVSENLRMLRRLCLFAHQNGFHAENLSTHFQSHSRERNIMLSWLMKQQEMSL